MKTGVIGSSWSERRVYNTCYLDILEFLVWAAINISLTFVSFINLTLVAVWNEKQVL